MRFSEIARISCAVAVGLLVSNAAPAQVRVVDGDTLSLDGVNYRLEGIDAPEHGQNCGDWACGTAATQALAGLIEGEKLTCNSHGTDGFGREIATCFAGDVVLGKAMVDKGPAWPFERYSNSYLEAGAVARARGTGIWAAPFQTPWDFRAERWSAAEQSAPAGCPIKGNISDSGRIYHPPWSPWYSRTRINEAKGERWFCSEAEALAAGWRAPRWR